MGNERKDSFSTLDSLPDKSGIDLRRLEEDLGTANENHEVLFRKCCCNSSWCPACGLPSIRERMSEIYMNWDYRRVRTYVLTVDRELYESPLEAFLRIQRKKELSEFMKRVKRRLMKHGIIIHDYTWLLEWHEDGFPHWHCLVLINKKGKAGRIANKIDLTETWGKAKFVKEGFIRDRNHWKFLAGYVAKHGYFNDGKKKQARLPEWVLRMPKDGDNRIRIKRMERMRKDIRNGGKATSKGEKPITKKDIELLLRTFNGKMYSEDAGDFENVFVGSTVTWGEYLERCGAKTLMTVSNKMFFLTIRITVPYKEIKKLNGEYREGQGYIVDLDRDQVIGLLKQEDEVVYYNRAESEIEWDFESLKKGEDDKLGVMDQWNLPF
jgi:hypothetical protein